MALGMRIGSRWALASMMEPSTMLRSVGESAGLRCLLAGALIGDWLEFLREVICKRLEHARNDLLHSGIRISKLQRKGSEQASGTPKLWRAFFQMLQKGKGLFYRVRNSDVWSTC